MKFNTFPGGFYIKLGTRLYYVSFLKSMHSVSLTGNMGRRLRAIITYVRRYTPCHVNITKA
ncbi:hypothetical protein LCGC14_0895110 [marine sediment metagenome]|uniref:Uncharacterized protein n=1 Tax=marine sediment metagenome TaxID=412755 RepID=A0A0F9RHG0_9ZZZZ